MEASVTPSELCSDSDLVGIVLSGDTNAFRLLVKRYSDGVYRFCLARLGDPEDAEDAVQDVFLRAFRSLATFDASRSFGSWLFGIAANRVRTRYVKRNSEVALLERITEEASGLESAPDNVDNPEELLLEVLSLEEIRTAVALLRPSYRAVVEMYYFAGLSVSETAASLEVGTEAVKSRLFRARKELGLILENRLQPLQDRRGRP
jgi:RNA polymerase sigma-70 factor, ECF subfamily